MARNLGIFTVAIVFILIVFLVYLIIRRCGSCCTRVKTLFANKLFYSCPIRYVMVGYIKLFN